MTDDELRCWLVERDYDDKGLVTVSYATPDGERRWRMQRAAAALSRRDVTAAVDVDPEDLEPTPEDLIERYRSEVERMRERHAPDEPV